LLLEDRCQLGSEQAAELVGAAAGRKGHDDLDRTARPLVGMRVYDRTQPKRSEQRDREPAHTDHSVSSQPRAAEAPLVADSTVEGRIADDPRAMTEAALGRPGGGDVAHRAVHSRWEAGAAPRNFG